MSSLSPDCDELKKKYEECFNEWYSTKFLRGDIRPCCELEFMAYKKCLKKALSKDNLDKKIEEAQKDVNFE